MFCRCALCHRESIRQLLLEIEKTFPASIDSVDLTRMKNVDESRMKNDTFFICLQLTKYGEVRKSTSGNLKTKSDVMNFAK